MLDASWQTIALVSTQNDHGVETEGIGAFGKLETVFERVFGCENRYDPRPIDFVPQIDGDVPQVRLLATANRTVGHEHESAQGHDLAHQGITVDPFLAAVFHRKIHSRR